MPARHFTGASTEFVQLGLGALVAFGPGSMAFVLRPTSLASTRCVFSAGASVSIGFRFALAASGKSNYFSNNSGALNPTTTVAINKWWLVGVSKATGSVAPRFHIYDYVTNTWAHENSGSTLGNSSAPATRAQFGVAADQTTTPFDGDIAACGVWNIVLSDAQFESLAYDLNAWWAPAQPKGLWLLDQDAVSQKVIDESGGGANQSAITGTTLGTSSVPVFTRGAEVIAA